MLSYIFKTVLAMSVSGGLLAAVLMLLSPLTRRILNPNRQYYIAFLSVIFLIIPVSFGRFGGITQNVSVTQTSVGLSAGGTNGGAEPREAYSGAAENNHDLNGLAQKCETAVPYMAVIWLTTALLLLCSKTEGYIWFIKEIYKNSSAADRPEGIPDRLEVRVTDMLKSPMITGLIRPALYLPGISVTPDERRFIFRHELVHYRRRDIAFKWLVMIVKCVHWFNPVVYILSEYIERECEASCDFVATRTMSATDKKRYMHTLVNMIECDAAALSFGAQMSAEKRGLKLRIKAVKHKRHPRRFVRAISALCAAVLTASGVYASGAVNKTLRTRLMSEQKQYSALSVGEKRSYGSDKGNGGKTLKEDGGRTAAERGNIGNTPSDETITNNDDANAENLSEGELNKTDTISPSEQAGESAKDADAAVIGNSEYAAEKPESGTGLTDTDADAAAEHGQKELRDRESGGTERTGGGISCVTYSGETPVIEGRYSSENGCRASEKGIRCGADGEFYIYFKANMNTVMMVEIFDSETRKSFGGYRLPSGAALAYMFDGFDPNRKYDVEIKSESGSDWRVDGVYYIYYGG